MVEFPDSYSDTTQNIAEVQLNPAGAEALKFLEEKGYEVHAGLTLGYADDIIAMALEPAIREYCPNDCGQRFADRAATEKWLSRRRGTFLLLKRDGQALRLAGYGWVGLGTNPHVPGGETTFAIRIGQLGQGQGLATPFTQAMLHGSAAIYGAKNMWLETWASNGAAVHVYHKVGFVDVAEEASARPTADGGNVADTRLFMSLPNEILG